MTPTEVKLCARADCRQPIPETRRTNARYCSTACQVAAAHERERGIDTIYVQGGYVGASPLGSVRVTRCWHIADVYDPDRTTTLCGVIVDVLIRSNESPSEDELCAKCARKETERG
jgi:hypothetical protein